MAPHIVAKNSNVLAIDYRGFGDSTGTPSAEGLLLDARTAFDFAAARDADVILVGQSLGTGVVAGLAGQLGNEGLSCARPLLTTGINPRAVILIAPFSRIADVLAS